MSVGFNEAMEQLQAMFTDFDKETIKMMLVQNNGYLEKTIEDLLKLGDNNPSGGNQQEDDGNLFSDLDNNNNNKQNQGERNLGDLGLFGGDDEYSNQDMARKMQEDEDAKLAYVLQQKYIKRSQAEAGGHQGHHQHGHHQQHGQNMHSSNVAQYDEDEYGDEEEDEEDGPNPEEYKNNRGGQQQQYQQNRQQQMSQSQQQTQPKKKKGFFAKIKGAFSGLGKKGKKSKGPTKNPGNYAEIDDGEEGDDGFMNFEDFGQPGRNDLYNKDDQNDFQLPKKKNENSKPIQMSEIMGIGDDFDDDFTAGGNYKKNENISSDHFNFRK